MNRYEKQIVGNYQVDTYVLRDTIIKPALPTLTLKSNRTFLAQNGKVAIKGEWEADDYGDFTLVEFNAGGKKVDEGRIYVGLNQVRINFGAPSKYYFPSFAEITFKKIN